MKQVLFIIITITLYSYFAGYGLTKILLTNKLSKYTIWLSPWIFFTLSTIVLTITSLLGVPISIAGVVVAVMTSLLSLYYLVIKRQYPEIFTKVNMTLVAIIVGSIIINISPIILRDKFLTTISFGNNDIIAYTTNADYLLKHSLAKSFQSDVTIAVNNLLHDGYRWGPPILEAHFLSITGLEGYQLSYLVQVLLFAFMIPLLYVLYSLLNNSKTDWVTAGFISLMMALNVNSLYMLYHNFWGLTYYLGIMLYLIIVLVTYFRYYKDKNIKLEILAIIGFVCMFISYHEPAVIIIFSLFLYAILLAITKNDVVSYIKRMLRILFGLVIMGGVSLSNAIVFDLKQAFIRNPNQVIGWQLFRDKLPYANPFEIVGLYSIHSFEPLNIFLAVILSGIVLFIIFLGIISIRNIKTKLYIFSYMTSITLLLLYLGIYRSNFFDYNRIVTYTLPIIIVIFSLGLEKILFKYKFYKVITYVILISLLIISTYNLNKRFVNERASVDYSYTSLKEIRSLKIDEQIYTESMYINGIPLWNRLWVNYFVYYDYDNIFSGKFINDPYKLRIPDNSLSLVSKTTPWKKAPQVLLTNIIWENAWYKLGRICNSNACLLSQKEDLSKIIVGQSEHEDSMLTNGWFYPDSSARWSSGKTSWLRLLKRDNHRYLVLNIKAYKEPQELTLIVQDETIEIINVSEEWSQYKIAVPNNIGPGVKNIQFVYSYTYQDPSLHNTNQFAVRVKEIYFE
jgi:hypothetical protein